MLPRVGVSSPPSIASSEVLPDPLGPTIAMNSPASAVSVTSRTDSTVWSPLPYTFQRFAVQSVAVIVRAPRLRLLLLTERDQRVDACHLTGADEGAGDGRHQQRHHRRHDTAGGEVDRHDITACLKRAVGKEGERHGHSE